MFIEKQTPDKLKPFADPDLSEYKFTWATLSPISTTPIRSIRTPSKRRLSVSNTKKLSRRSSYPPF